MKQFKGNVVLETAGKLTFLELFIETHIEPTLRLRSAVTNVNYFEHFNIIIYYTKYLYSSSHTMPQVQLLKSG